MKVSLNWLKEFIPDLNADAEDIVLRLTAAGIEIDAVENLGLDKVIELDLTPNRSDCLSMRGAAYEIAALYRLKVKLPSIPSLPVRVDSQKIKIEAPEHCSSYLALLIDDLHVEESPEWLKHKLEKAGMRSINNIVDLSNLVMLEIGEPLHTFDYDKLAEGCIIVRDAIELEEIKTLDDQERVLAAGTLLICDAQKPVAIAGVMGDATSEVTSATKSLLVEAACFEKRSIRRTSKMLGLRSEAALRFEKGVDPVALKQALERFAMLITELGYGKVQNEIISAEEYQPAATIDIQLRRKQLYLISGLTPTDDYVKDALHSLGFEVADNETGWLVTVPTRRQDITIEVDLIEEVARLIGFDSLPALLPEGRTTIGVYTEQQKALRMIRQTLINTGLNEVLNYSFLDSQSKIQTWLRDHDLQYPLIPLTNPLSSNYSHLRSSLLPSVMQTMLYNLNHRNNNVYIFEMGAVFLADQLPLQKQPKEEQRLFVALTGLSNLATWSDKPKEADYYSAKGILEQLQIHLNLEFQLEPLTGHSLFHPYRAVRVLLDQKEIGFLGELHPEFLEYIGLDQRVTVLDLDLDTLINEARQIPDIAPTPRYPAIERDLALITPRDLPSQDVLDLIRSLGGELLEQVRLFDDYRGLPIAPHQKNLAFNLVYRSQDKTLTDAEVNELHSKIVAQAQDSLGAKLRL